MAKTRNVFFMWCWGVLLGGTSIFCSARVLLALHAGQYDKATFNLLLSAMNLVGFVLQCRELKDYYKQRLDEERDVKIRAKIHEALKGNNG